MLDVPTLYDPTEYNTHLLELPGTLYTLDEQCEQLLGTGSTYCGVNIQLHQYIEIYYMSHKIAQTQFIQVQLF